MMTSANLILFTGRPGSGKTTQAQILAKRRNFRHLSAGDIARNLAQTDTETREALDAGQLAPREKMNDAMYAILKKHNKVGGTLILDGYPRYFYQLADLLHAQKTEPAFVVLDCRSRIATERLVLRARNDDGLEQITERQRTFETETEPVIDWLFRRHPAELVQFINAEHDVTRVTSDVDGFIRYTL
jgi:adenylate kinase family enzyme